MNMIVRRTLGSLLFSLLLALVSITPVSADSPSPPHPDRPNLGMDMSRQTVVVYVANTTPYNMTLKDAGPFIDLPSDPTAPVIFSPSGIPHKIPANYGASFVAAWKDAGDSVYKEADLTYTMDNVDVSNIFQPPVCSGKNQTGCCTNPYKGSIDIHFELDRVKKDSAKDLKAEFGQLIFHSVHAAVDFGEFVTEGNPVALLKFMKAADEMTNNVKEINSQKNSDYDQLFVNSYVVNYKNDLSYVPGLVAQVIEPGSKNNDLSDYAPNDGIATQQPDANGCTQSGIVAAVSVLRAQVPDHGTFNGGLPTVLVALFTEADWRTVNTSQVSVSAQESPAGYKIKQQLQREGKTGLKAFRTLVHSLSPQDFRLMSEAYGSITAHKKLTHEQEAFLVRLAGALEKHAASLPAPTTPQSAEHKTPVHKSK